MKFASLCNLGQVPVRKPDAYRTPYAQPRQKRAEIPRLLRSYISDFLCLIESIHCIASIPGSTTCLTMRTTSPYPFPKMQSPAYQSPAFQSSPVHRNILPKEVHLLAGTTLDKSIGSQVPRDASPHTPTLIMNYPRNFQTSGEVPGRQSSRLTYLSLEPEEPQFRALVLSIKYFGQAIIYCGISTSLFADDDTSRVARYARCRIRSKQKSGVVHSTYWYA